MSNLVIQTNVAANNSHRALKIIGGKQFTSSARLSSGYKINSAADDSSGLAISEKMRAQIRGLDMASKNAQDGVSLVQTAEGGLTEIDNMVQRIRELVVQAANDTNDFATADRKKLQDEIDQLTQGIDQMASQVEFNAKRLLDGALMDNATKGSLLADLTVKANNLLGTAAQNISVGGSKVDALAGIINANEGKIGVQYAAATGKAIDAEITYNITVTAGGQTGVFNVTVNAPTMLSGNSTDTASTVINATLNSKNASSASSTSSGMDAGILVASKYNGETGSQQFIIQGITYSRNTSTANWTVVGDATNSTWTLEVSYASSFNQAIQGTKSIQTDWTYQSGSVAAAIVVVGSDVTSVSDMFGGTTRTDGAALTVIGTSNVKDVGSLIEYVGAIDEYMGKLQDAKKNGAEVEELLSNLAYNRQAALDIYSGLELASALYNSYGDLNKCIAGTGLWFQTGANSTQGMIVGIGKISSEMLGIGKGNGISTIKVDKPRALEISAQIDIVDNALQYVTAQRAKLGAVQNRLEFTKNSLDISSENLTASESRIRDADMGKEMMKLTAANILQQAGVSMLAQANQNPQSVLQLLR